MKLRLHAMAPLVFAFSFVTAIASPAQTFNTLVNFDGTDGYEPQASLVQGVDGNFYGTTEFGGANSSGEVFKMTPGGTLTVLYSFCPKAGCTDGAQPLGGLVEGTNGAFYGTTAVGGTSNSFCPDGCGTVFMILLEGKLTTLHRFAGPDGGYPSAALVQAIDGSFYGTTDGGGAVTTCTSYAYPTGCGTVFRITPGGRLTAVHSFDGADGYVPNGGVIQATDGSLYGTTAYGGANDLSVCEYEAINAGCGTVFKIAPAGKLTSLHSFDSSDGANPFAGLVQGADGNFYGTTASGGSSTYDGTVFKITSAGALTTIYDFSCSEGYCLDGTTPVGGLVQATDGNFYGTTEYDGDVYGTAFEITSEGVLTPLFYFGAGFGLFPTTAMIQGTDGTLYGTTPEGGSNFNCSEVGCGTVYDLSVGLGPFVKTLPAAGKAGAEVGILGTNLTAATGVTFNGAAARFTVNSSTLVLADVPASATTGMVEVTLPGGTLSSNVPFYVLP